MASEMRKRVRNVSPAWGHHAFFAGRDGLAETDAMFSYRIELFCY